MVTHRNPRTARSRWLSVVCSVFIRRGKRKEEEEHIHKKIRSRAANIKNKKKIDRFDCTVMIIINKALVVAQRIRSLVPQIYLISFCGWSPKLFLEAFGGPSDWLRCYLSTRGAITKQELARNFSMADFRTICGGFLTFARWTSKLRSIKCWRWLV